MKFQRPPVDPFLAEKARELRKHMTPEERHLWYDYLKNCSHFVNRQYVITPYIVDFFCQEIALAIEIDGSQHYEAEGLRKDAERTAYLESLGAKVIRFTNRDIHEHFEAVCLYIDSFFQQES